MYRHSFYQQLKGSISLVLFLFSASLSERGKENHIVNGNNHRHVRAALKRVGALICIKKKIAKQKMRKTSGGNTGLRGDINVTDCNNKHKTV